MRGLVTDRLDDEDFETGFIDQSLNEAQWEILNKRNLTFLEKSVSLTLLAGASSVPFPTDLRSIISIRATSPSGSYDLTDAFIDYADYQQALPTSTVTQAPTAYTTFAGNMLFLGQADQQYTITIDYIKEAPRVSLESDTFLIPDAFQELLKIGAYMRIAKREDDYDVKQQEKIDYDKLLTDLTAAYKRNPSPRKKHVMRIGR
jgi:hypothetical protein